MSKKCGRCEKTVYPTEELNCLDKTWHKACFKCKECNMTLNMKNYKGYNKEPYCNAHYPTTKFTSVADTPEARRLSSNTRIQSQVQYHADFEKQKGRMIAVAEDPEMLRHKTNTAITSNVAYHGVLEQRDNQEKRRPSQIQEDTSTAVQQSQPSPTVSPPSAQEPRTGSAGGMQANGSVAAQGPPSLPRPEGRVYKAIYDYQAQDDDEIGFEEGDLIINCEPIDEGWMQGMHKKSGQVGMLPANYVELVL